MSEDYRTPEFQRNLAARDFWERCYFGYIEARKGWANAGEEAVIHADAQLAAWRKRFEPPPAMTIGGLA